MSTNAKDLHPMQLSEAAITKSKKTVDRSVRNVMQEMQFENTLAAESPTTRLQKVLKIYRSIKPMLAVIGALPLLPSNWRSTFIVFTQALESLSQVGGELTADFKAGKDL
jgi:hypothetical protein